jgi:hypothetical protein
VNPIDLARKCAENINFATKHGLPIEDASIMITTPKGWKAPPRFPRGRIVQWKEDGSRVRTLPAAKVLAWLAGNGLVNVKIETLNEPKIPTHND